VLTAKPEIVLAPDVADIGAYHVLVVAEQERVGHIGIADGGKVRNVEARIAALEAIRAVGPRDSQIFQAVILIDIDVLRAQALPREADSWVRKQAGRDRVGAAHGRGLNAAGSIAGLASRQRVATGWPERRRIENERRRIAIAREQRGFVSGVVVHLEVEV